MPQPGKNTQAYKNKLRYTQEFTKQNYKQFKIMLHKENDADLIEFLTGIDNKNGYLKELIRRDMEKGSH